MAHQLTMNPAAVMVLALLVLAPDASPIQRRPTRKLPAVSAAVRRERPVPFQIGETLTYDVAWSSYVSAGTVVVSVKEKRPSFDSTAYYIVAEARPAPLLSKLYTLYYKIDTLIDAYTLLPQRGSIYTEEGNRHHLKTTRFDRRQQKVFFEYQSGNTINSEFAVPALTQDALSAIYAMRSIPLKAGDHMTMPVSDDGVTYRMGIDVAAPEYVKTPLGELNAWKIVPVVTDDKGQTVGRNLAVWISDDARRYPLKMQAEVAVGNFNLLLREAR